VLVEGRAGAAPAPVSTSPATRSPRRGSTLASSVHMIASFFLWRSSFWCVFSRGVARLWPAARAADCRSRHERRKTSRRKLPNRGRCVPALRNGPSMVVSTTRPVRAIQIAWQAVMRRVLQATVDGIRPGGSVRVVSASLTRLIRFVQFRRDVPIGSRINAVGSVSERR